MFLTLRTVLNFFFDTEQPDKGYYALKIIMVLEGLVKITKQIRGTENIFGYHSTTSNQLHLLYCISGEIYFGDKIRPFVRYSWFVVNLFGVIIPFTSGPSCLLHDNIQDARQLMDIATAVGIATDISIVLPCILYYYRSNIENTIDGIDKILSKPISKINIQRTRIKPIIIRNFYIMSALICVHSFTCILDIVLFYEEEKVKNFQYYMFPWPDIENNGSSVLFIFDSLLLMFGSPLYWFLWIAGVTMIALWGTTCHNELMYLKDRLDFNMNRLNSLIINGYEKSQKWHRTFNQTLIKHMEDFETINRLPTQSKVMDKIRVQFDNTILHFRMIDQFRGLTQVYCSLAVPVNFLVQVVRLYSIISVSLSSDGIN